MDQLVVLGAEEQGATSLALAYPDRQFLFVSDGAVIDGWDLPNVVMRAGSPVDTHNLFDARREVVALSARWLPDPDRYSLAVCAAVVDGALPVTVRPQAPVNIIKGARWHRPDGPLSGTNAELENVAQISGEGVLYQPYVCATATIMIVGRRWASGVVKAGAFRVNQERFFRIDVLQAAESVDAVDMVRESVSVLHRLDYFGWFTFNWLMTAEGPRLSSLRPVPKALFGCFRRGGIDLLDEAGADLIPPGLRTIFVPSYAQYQRLHA